MKFKKVHFLTSAKFGDRERTDFEGGELVEQGIVFDTEPTGKVFIPLSNVRYGIVDPERVPVPVPLVNTPPVFTEQKSDKSAQKKRGN